MKRPHLQFTNQSQPGVTEARMTEPIPQPLVLDPDRELSDDREDMTVEEHRSRARRLDAALHDTCDYAKQLWTDVARARQYLFDSLPPDPRRPASERVGTSPTGPDDDAGWQRWEDAYSELTSVLAGPHGDSGMGRSEARAAATLRRTAPNARLRAEHPDLMHAVAPIATTDAAENFRPPDLETRHRDSPHPPLWQHIARPLAVGALVALALRGLRPVGRLG